MESLSYSLKQVEHLLEAAKVLIPVCTGYVLLAVAGIRQLLENKLLAIPSARFLVVASFVLVIVSIGFWCGVLAFMVDCSNPFDRAQGSASSINAKQLNLEWTLGLLCAQLALISFFSSITLYCSLAYKLLLSVKRNSK